MRWFITHVEWRENISAECLGEKHGTSRFIYEDNIKMNLNEIGHDVNRFNINKSILVS